MNLSIARRKFTFLLLAMPLLALAMPVKIDLSIVRRKPESGVRTVRVAKGESVTIEARGDEAFTLHVHGYNVETRIGVNATSSILFEADIVGRFPVSAHWLPAPGDKRAPETTLLYLEVHPQ